jgi:8-oxo-dGTP pyrophosphatase MutT (NUDIX family)
MELQSTRDKPSQPKIPRPASTVVLIRHLSGDLQVYLLRRSSRSGFMPGNYVFPGGTVDPEDRAPGFWKAHVDMDSKSISRRLGGDVTVDEAIAYGVAAVRETFEEAGVFLAHRSQQGPHDLEKVYHRREVATLPKGWLRGWVASEGWTLELSRLAKWSHWITPEARSRRYDTRFFLALMPAGQQCIPDTMETTHGIWISPEKGLDANLQGSIPLSPPTLVTLHELQKYHDMKTLEKELENRQWGETRIPLLIRSSQETMIVLPWDPMYDHESEIDVNAMAKITLGLDQNFSRLWYHEGIWRPVQNR